MAGVGVQLWEQQLRPDINEISPEGLPGLPESNSAAPTAGCSDALPFLSLPGTYRCLTLLILQLIIYIACSCPLEYNFMRVVFVYFLPMFRTVPDTGFQYSMFSNE